jgi:hypothetical protein
MNFDAESFRDSFLSGQICEGALDQPSACPTLSEAYTLHDGRVVYSKGNDHIIDAVRCALLHALVGRLRPFMRQR